MYRLMLKGVRSRIQGFSPGGVLGRAMACQICCMGWTVKDDVAD